MPGHNTQRYTPQQRLFHVRDFDAVCLNTTHDITHYSSGCFMSETSTLYAWTQHTTLHTTAAAVSCPRLRRCTPRHNTPQQRLFHVGDFDVVCLDTTHNVTHRSSGCFMSETSTLYAWTQHTMLHNIATIAGPHHCQPCHPQFITRQFVRWQRQANHSQSQGKKKARLLQEGGGGRWGEWAVS